MASSRLRLSWKFTRPGKWFANCRKNLWCTSSRKSTLRRDSNWQRSLQPAPTCGLSATVVDRQSRHMRLTWVTGGCVYSSRMARSSKSGQKWSSFRGAPTYCQRLSPTFFWRDWVWHRADILRYLLSAAPYGVSDPFGPSPPEASTTSGWAGHCSSPSQASSHRDSKPEGAKGYDPKHPITLCLPSGLASSPSRSTLEGCSQGCARADLPNVNGQRQYLFVHIFSGRRREGGFHSCIAHDGLWRAASWLRYYPWTRPNGKSPATLVLHRGPNFWMSTNEG